jgi:hypothetical protein
MTTSTARYRFEYKVFDWAEQFGDRMCGGVRSFFVGVRPDGAVRRVYFERSARPFDSQRKRALADAHTHWFLFQTHGERGAGYVEWFELEQGVIQRWLGGDLESEDLDDVRGSGALHAWPACWRVILG